MLPANRKKRWILIFLTSVVVILLILAAGLTGLRLNDKFSFTLSPRLPNAAPVGPIAGWYPVLTFFRIVLAISLITFPFYLVYMLIDAKRRKQLFKNIAVFLLILFIFDRLRDLSQRLANGNNGALDNGLAAAPQPATGPSVPSFFSSPPEWLVTVAGVTVGVALVALAFSVYWFVLRKRYNDAEAIRQVETQAEEAMQAIQAGGDLKAIIIECYKQMILTVRKERGINRASADTPQEFGNFLIQRGLPSGPVRDLTHLFEQARYGRFEGGYRYQLEAVSCLEEIIFACKRRVKPA